MANFNINVSENSYECTHTVDCAVFGFQEGQLKVLLVKRAIAPHQGLWMLPGGVMGEGVTLESAVNRVLEDLTGIRDIHQEQVATYSRVDRHPSKRVVTTCFYALVRPENHNVKPLGHVSDVDWFPVNNLPDMGFDHSVLASDALIKLKDNFEHHLIVGELLPQLFTLKELQELYESILGVALDRRNFRKKILQQKVLVNTGAKKPGKGGPELFRIERKAV